MASYDNSSSKENSTGVTIEGLRIEFPYVPYDCQVAFMQAVVSSLNAHAALESPTGTGKTLSLLCASLAWLQREKEKIRPPIQTALSTGIVMLTSAGKTMTGSAIDSAAQLHPRIFYASRTHSQLKQVVKELNKTRYASLVKVATLAGRDQLCLNEKVAKEKNSEIKAHVCRQMVSTCKCHFYNMLEKEGDSIDELYQSHSKDQAMDIEDLVRVAKNLRHCPYYRAKQMYADADLILLPYNYILDPKTREAFEVKLRGNILIFDEAHNLESVAEQSMSVDFSTKMLAMAIKECKKVLELLVEEEESARTEGDNTMVTFAALMSSKTKTRKEPTKKEDEKKLKTDEVASLLQYLHTFEAQIDAIDLEKSGVQIAKLPGRVFPGRRMLEMLERAGISRLLRDAICKLIDKIGLFLAKDADSNAGIWAEKATGLGEFASFIARALADTFEPPSSSVINRGAQRSIPVRSGDASQNFKLYVETTASNSSSVSETKLHYWCFAAGVAMRYLASRDVHSILLASGTLSPMQEFLSTMAIPFGNTLSSGHAAKETQLIMGAMTKGPAGHDLLGTFQRRNDTSYKSAIGELVLMTVSSTPQGVLVFFPSYPQMAAFVEHWKATPKHKGEKHYWSCFERYKRIFVEPQDKTELQATFHEFDTAVREGFSRDMGAMLLAVCRGKISEGIDFADSHCRAVLVVGIPFPPLFDPRVILKKLFLADVRKENSKAMNPEEWYRVEGIRAVNQAIGRVIRHKDDFGVVILADSRFAAMETKVFPVWTRSAFKVHQAPATLFNEVKRFFAERGILVRQSHEQQIAFTSSAMTRRPATSRLTEGFHLSDGYGVGDILAMYGGAIRQKEAESRSTTLNSSSRLQALPSTSSDAQMASQVSDSPSAGKLAELDKLVDWLVARPGKERLYPTNLRLPADAKERVLAAVSKTTRLDVRQAIGPVGDTRQKEGEEVPPARKRVKLKSNTRLGESEEASSSSSAQWPRKPN